MVYLILGPLLGLVGYVSIGMAVTHMVDKAQAKRPEAINARARLLTEANKAQLQNLKDTWLALTGKQIRLSQIRKSVTYLGKDSIGRKIGMVIYYQIRGLCDECHMLTYNDDIKCQICKAIDYEKEMSENERRVAPKTRRAIRKNQSSVPYVRNSLPIPLVEISKEEKSESKNSESKSSESNSRNEIWESQFSDVSDRKRAEWYEVHKPMPPIPNKRTARW